MFPLYAAGTVFIFSHLIAARLQDQQRLLPLPVNFTSAIKRTGRVSADFYRRGFRLRKTIDTFGQCRAGKCCAQYHRSNRQITVHHLLRVKTSQQRSESCFGMQSAGSGKFLIVQVVISQPAVRRSEHSDRRLRHELRGIMTAYGKLMLRTCSGRGRCCGARIAVRTDAYDGRERPARFPSSTSTLCCVAAPEMFHTSKCASSCGTTSSIKASLFSNAKTGLRRIS